MLAGYQRRSRSDSRIGRVTAEAITPNDDDVTARQLARIDMMLQECYRILTELEPLIPLVPRALALLDPGAAMRRHLKPKRGKDA